MSLVCNGEIQYVNVYYTRQMSALCGDRRSKGKSNPIFELYNDSQNERILLKVREVVPEDMYSKKAKERMDIYILKSGSEILRDGLEDILDAIEGIPVITTMDRSKRGNKDPRFKYTLHGLPLDIVDVGTWVKIDAISVDMAEANMFIETQRHNQTDEIPRMSVDVEHAGSRMHFGFETDWIQRNGNANQSVIDIFISWSELGHLLGAVRSAITKLK